MVHNPKCPGNIPVVNCYPSPWVPVYRNVSLCNSTLAPQRCLLGNPVPHTVTFVCWQANNFTCHHSKFSFTKVTPEEHQQNAQILTQFCFLLSPNLEDATLHTACEGPRCQHSVGNGERKYTFLFWLFYSSTVLATCSLATYRIFQQRNFLHVKSTWWHHHTLIEELSTHRPYIY